MINSKVVGEFLDSMVEDFADHLEYKYGFGGANDGVDEDDDDFVEYYDSEAFGVARCIVNILCNPKRGYDSLSEDRKGYLLSGLEHLKGDLEECLTEVAEFVDMDPGAEAEAIINFIKEDVK